MRLTLRTLLAYLDDVLEPAQAKEIGQKIKESSVATDLVERIREVMRRRRLGAPDVEDGSLQGNPNTVAEYLDNILTPDQVTQLERVCLESDVNLSEVAAAHQILSLVLGEPISVSAATKERMYALAGVKKTSDSKVGIPTYEPPANTAERVAALAGSGVIPKGAIPPAEPAPLMEANDEDFIEVPKEIRPAPLWKKALPWGIVAVALSLWMLVTFGDARTWEWIVRGGRSDVQQKIVHNDPKTPIPETEKDSDKTKPEIASNSTADQPGEGTPPGETPETEKPEPPVEVADTQPTQENPEAVSSKQKAKTEEDEAPKLTDEPADEKPMPANPSSEPPSLADSETETEKPAAPIETDPPAEVASNSTTAKTPEETKPDVNPKESEAPAEKRTAMAAEYRSIDGILLYREKNGSRWQVKPHHASLRDEELLAVPEPFDAQITLTGSGHSLNLQSKTAIQWIGPKEKADGGFILKRGQVAFRPRAAGEAGEGDAETPMTVTVTSGLDSWVIQVLTPDTVSGIEVIPYEPQKFEEGVKTDRNLVNLCVAKGSVKYARIDGPLTDDQFRIVDGPMTLSLPTKYQKDDAVDNLMADLTGDLTAGRKLPGGRLQLGYEWLNDARPAAQRNRNSRPFEKEFERAIDQPIEPVMLQVSKDRNSLLAKLAATTLGLIGDHDDLVQILQKTEHAEVRREAIQELRIWLVEAPENGRLLQDDLTAHFSAEDAAILYQLMWGYEMASGTNPDVSTMLVNLLGHSNDSIRELAFLHVRRLTNNRQNDYRPNSPENTRQIGVNNWKRFLERNGGTLVALPEPKPAESKPAEGATGAVPINRGTKLELKTPKE